MEVHEGRNMVIEWWLKNDGSYPDIAMSKLIDFIALRDKE